MSQRLAVRLRLVVRPIFAFAVEPGGVHAGLQSSHSIQGAVVAYVQDVGYRDAYGGSGGFEDAGVGLGLALRSHGRNPLRAILGRCHGSAHFVEYSAF